MEPLSTPQLFVLFAGSLAGGFINSMAGGGTIFVFSILASVGVSPVIANTTTTVALCPGYAGGALAQWSELKAQWKRLLLLAPIVLVGGFAGAYILLKTPAQSFQLLIPWFILLASGLLFFQDGIKRLIEKPHKKHSRRLVGIVLFVSAVYGGYFGVGLSVIYLAALGFLFVDSTIRLNAVKHALSFLTNTIAALYFILSGKIFWGAMVLMAAGAILGGLLGGRLAAWVPQGVLRKLAAAGGMLIAGYFFIR